MTSVRFLYLVNPGHSAGSEEPDHQTLLNCYIVTLGYLLVTGCPSCVLKHEWLQKRPDKLPEIHVPNETNS